MLGSGETVRLTTVASGMEGVNFFEEGERTKQEFYFLEGGRNRLSQGRNNSKEITTSYSVSLADLHVSGGYNDVSLVCSFSSIEDVVIVISCSSRSRYFCDFGANESAFT